MELDDPFVYSIRGYKSRAVTRLLIFVAVCGIAEAVIYAMLSGSTLYFLSGLLALTVVVAFVISFTILSRVKNDTPAIIVDKNVICIHNPNGLYQVIKKHDILRLVHLSQGYGDSTNADFYIILKNGMYVPMSSVWFDSCPLIRCVIKDKMGVSFEHESKHWFTEEKIYFGECDNEEAKKIISGHIPCKL